MFSDGISFGLERAEWSFFFTDSNDAKIFLQVFNDRWGDDEAVFIIGRSLHSIRVLTLNGDTGNAFRVWGNNII